MRRWPWAAHLQLPYVRFNAYTSGRLYITPVGHVDFKTAEDFNIHQISGHYYGVHAFETFFFFLFKTPANSSEDFILNFPKHARARRGN